ncbi:MAG: serine/threonine-protein kinase, partial [Panacagrimonas sp.]
MNAPSVLADGTWIDNFRLVRRLGRGGFGVTYLAEEFREWEAGTGTGSPLRLVALKEYFPRGLATRPDGQTVTLSPDVEGGEQAFQMALKGFFQEAESLMRFDHPNVIKIHRVFQRNGTAYYIMPFLKGETLKAILKREGAMGEERTRRLMLPILDGLVHAHAKGILHRDLKPDNVMIPDEGGPVLIDFGAARAQAVDDVTEYTRHSELVAYTPGYAALEQYGRATRDNPHGAHTDVYGLAAVLYHCVTGEAPVEASLRSMQLSNGATDPLVPASSKLMDTPGYGRAFLSAIDWGLELAGRNRPQTVAEFRRGLDGKLTLPE